jgi:propionate CoA-transferase
MRQITTAQAAALLQEGDTLLIGGSGGGHAVPDALLAAVGERFRTTGAPRAVATALAARGPCATIA